MTKEETVLQLQAMAEECRELAAAFKPAASEGQIIRVPAVLVLKLCECLERGSDAMANMAREVAS